ncbi:MAG: hypothetical protein ACRYF0_15635 [Janthinobacterium lividum]
MADLLPVQQQMADLLQAGRALTVRWNCGGDESFVTTELDGAEVRADYNNDADFAMLLDRYLTELLDLPDAGEFSMEGTGRIFREEADVVIEYESVFTDDGTGLLSDEEWREMGLDPDEWRSEAKAPNADGAPAEPQPDPTYSGRRVLFTLT